MIQDRHIRLIIITLPVLVGTEVAAVKLFWKARRWPLIATISNRTPDISLSGREREREKKKKKKEKEKERKKGGILVFLYEDCDMGGKAKSATGADWLLYVSR